MRKSITVVCASLMVLTSLALAQGSELNRTRFDEPGMLNPVYPLDTNLDLNGTFIFDSEGKVVMEDTLRVKEINYSEGGQGVRVEGDINIRGSAQIGNVSNVWFHDREGSGGNYRWVKPDSNEMLELDHSNDFGLNFLSLDRVDEAVYSGADVGVGVESPQNTFVVGGASLIDQDISVSGSTSISSDTVLENGGKVENLYVDNSDPSSMVHKQYVNSHGYRRTTLVDGTELTSGNDWHHNRGKEVAQICGVKGGQLFAAHNDKSTSGRFRHLGAGVYEPDNNGQIRWDHDDGSRVTWKPGDWGTSEIKSGNDWTHDSGSHLWVWCKHPIGETRGYSVGSSLAGTDKIYPLDCGGSNCDAKINVTNLDPDYGRGVLRINVTAHYGCFNVPSGRFHEVRSKSLKAGNSINLSYNGISSTIVCPDGSTNNIQGIYTQTEALISGAQTSCPQQPDIEQDITDCSLYSP